MKSMNHIESSVYIYIYIHCRYTFTCSTMVSCCRGVLRIWERMPIFWANGSNHQCPDAGGQCSRTLTPSDAGCRWYVDDTSDTSDTSCAKVNGLDIDMYAGYNNIIQYFTLFLNVFHRTTVAACQLFVQFYSCVYWSVWLSRQNTGFNGCRRLCRIWIAWVKLWELKLLIRLVSM